MTTETPNGVITFWTDEIGQSGWFSGAAEVDDAIRQRFTTTWEAARDGMLEHWRDCAAGTLAYLLVTDQFPRNLFRNDPAAFATDGLARRAAKSGLSNGFDLRIDEPLRQFYYLPLTHSESAPDQERGVRLMIERLPATGANNVLHARAHRDVIRAFGRFPHRNAALGRTTNSAERAFLDQGGYGAAVQRLSA